MYLKPVLSFVCEQKALTDSGLLKVTKCQHFLQHYVDPNSLSLFLTQTHSNYIQFCIFNVFTPLKIIQSKTVKYSYIKFLF